MKGGANYYKPGSYNVICDICHKKRKREQVRPRWDGFMACIDKGCWSPKPKFEKPLPVIPDGLSIPNARPRNVSYAHSLPRHKVTDDILIDDPLMTVDDDPNNSARMGIIYMFGKYIQT